MKPSELKQMIKLELLNKLDSSMEELFNIRFLAAKNGMEKPSNVRKLKKDVARIKTILKEKSIKE